MRNVGKISWNLVYVSRIDIYLNSLVGDLKLLWVNGVEVFDVVAFETFIMHAMLFCTINDFLAYGNFSGYNVKGHKACHICEETLYLINWKIEGRLYICVIKGFYKLIILIEG